MKTIKITSPVEIHKCAKEKGWWSFERPLPELLCLLHSEVSEALEAYRNRIPEGKKGCLSEEFADIIIRLFDICEAFGIDIAEAVKKKHEYNLKRPFRHGNKRC